MLVIRPVVDNQGGARSASWRSPTGRSRDQAVGPRPRNPARPHRGRAAPPYRAARARLEKLIIAGLPAVHAAAVIDSRRGPLALDLTWIAYAGRVYRVTGIAPAGRAEAFRAAWRETAASFRPLTTSERHAIRETRLRIARARQGETIGDVVRRAG